MLQFEYETNRYLIFLIKIGSSLKNASITIINLKRNHNRHYCLLHSLHGSVKLTVSVRTNLQATVSGKLLLLSFLFISLEPNGTR